MKERGLRSAPTIAGLALQNARDVGEIGTDTARIVDEAAEHRGLIGTVASQINTEAQQECRSSLAPKHDSRTQACRGSSRPHRDRIDHEQGHRDQ
jgi:hypothetical protein